MSLPKILVQLDPDAHASVFDAVVAVDSEVDHLLQYNNVEPLQVRDLVHGTIFTRSVDELNQTAIFIGGADVAQGEELLERVTETFFGPMRVSVMMDTNGANTTAAAAVVAAQRHMQLGTAKALVLGGTGSVGQRAALMLATAGAHVKVTSRDQKRAAAAAQCIAAKAQGIAKSEFDPAQIVGIEVPRSDDLDRAIDGVNLVIGAGASGVELLPAEIRKRFPNLDVVIDLNAVPPLGVEGVEVDDKAVLRDGAICYGAVGVGRTKMKIHKAAVRCLFMRKDLVMDAAEIFQLGSELDEKS